MNAKAVYTTKGDTVPEKRTQKPSLSKGNKWQDKKEDRKGDKEADTPTGTRTWSKKAKEEARRARRETRPPEGGHSILSK